MFGHTVLHTHTHCLSPMCMGQLWISRTRNICRIFTLNCLFEVRWNNQSLMNRRRQYNTTKKRNERKEFIEWTVHCDCSLWVELSWAINVRYFSHFIALKCQKFQNGTVNCFQRHNYRMIYETFWVPYCVVYNLPQSFHLLYRINCDRHHAAWSHAAYAWYFIDDTPRVREADSSAFARLLCLPFSRVIKVRLIDRNFLTQWQLNSPPTSARCHA